MGLTAAAQAQTDAQRAYTAEMLSQAQSHTNTLAQPPATAVNVGGQIQFRWIFNSRDDSGLVEDTTTGFQTRRTKLDFTGNIINKDWTFRVLSAFDRDGGAAVLEEAWVQYRFGNGWNARWGQFKLPLNREELVSSSRQLAAERSVVNEFFTQDRSQGIELSYDTENMRFVAAFSDGLDSENTDFAGEGLEADYAVTGRFEYKFQGTWSRFADFTSRQGDDFASMLGGAAHWQHNDTPGFTDTDLLQYTADLSLEGDGWNAFGAFVGRYSDMDGAASVNDMGFVIQAGYRFAPETELFARWDALWPDDDRGDDLEDLYNFITVGLNQYYAGHAAKATIDLVWALEETDDLAALGTDPENTGLGLLGSSDDSEIALRLQFQLLF